MKAFGYEVKGCKEALCDVRKQLYLDNQEIGWINYNTGDPYCTADGKWFEVVADHESRHIVLLPYGGDEL